MLLTQPRATRLSFLPHRVQETRFLPSARNHAFRPQRIAPDGFLAASLSSDGSRNSSGCSICQTTTAQKQILSRVLYSRGMTKGCIGAFFSPPDNSDTYQASSRKHKSWGIKNDVQYATRCSSICEDSSLSYRPAFFAAADAKRDTAVRHLSIHNTIPAQNTGLPVDHTILYSLNVVFERSHLLRRPHPEKVSCVGRLGVYANYGPAYFDHPVLCLLRP
ncbi:hypothetical protein M433DRAFT_346937 [Acidomyces richmondensis BFW]|nr:MAG: hypothetical protein FE78DRAFT_530254 [Acidomyces sp. 'richmondensis']KYG50544.1 hypothetical protein M433DRAFT_346937 [Acidomyces richmondensis BFW]